MKLTAVSIARPLAISMGLIALVLMGWIAHSRLAVDLLPNVQVPYVSVSVAYPGANPRDVERLVTKPLEDALGGLAHVQHVNSTSSEGQSRVTVQFSDGTNVDLAAIDVERAVSSVRGELPAAAHAPSISKFDTSQQAILYITVAGDRPQDQLFAFADHVAKPRLEAVDGVAAVGEFGGLDREIDVQFDPARMAAHHVSLSQVVNALAQGNQTQPSGSIEQGSQQFDVRVVGEAASPQALGKLVVSPGNGNPITIDDVARVVDTHKQQTVITHADGQPAVALAIYKQSTGNTVQVADSVKQTISALQKVAPQGVVLSTVFDSSTTTRDSLADVNDNLIAAVILTGVVLFLFLHTFRSTLIVLLAIPTSLISTYAVMYVLGFTLNLLSLMALALLIGILVDDSIVVLENITRHVDLGEPPRQAAFIGRTEIGLAAITITFVDVVVYTPVAFMSGTVGAFFRQFGLTITAATIFSLLVSFTLTPMLASRWLIPPEQQGQAPWVRFGRRWNAGLARIAGGYARVVAWAIARTWHRLLVVLTAILLLLFGLSLVVVHAVGTEFLPTTDQGLVEVSVRLPAGSSLAATSAITSRLEKITQAQPEVDHALTIIGNGASRDGSIYAQLKPLDQRHRSDAQVAAAIQKASARIPGARITASTVSGSGSGQAISYKLEGNSLRELAKLGDETAAAIAAVPGTTNVRNHGAASLPEIHITVDQQKLADVGLTTADVAHAVTVALEGDIATHYQPAGKPQVDVLVIADPTLRSDPQTLLTMPITAPNGTQVVLNQVAHIDTAFGPAAIDRTDRQRQITVTGDLNVNGRSLGEVTSMIRARLKTIPLPPGYKFVQGGTGQQQADAFTALLQALALSALLMYMLMVALYESFTTPFVIMLSLPTAVVGALVALAITRNTLNVFSLIGFIMLLGLVAKNAILLVDFTNTLRSRGVARDEAIRQAGQTRLRPILMTTSAMVLAMLPLALKIGPGADLRASMGVALIGGLLSSLLLTLVLVPVVYTIVDDTVDRTGRVGRWLTRPFHRRKPTTDADLERLLHEVVPAHSGQE